MKSGKQTFKRILSIAAAVALLAVIAVELIGCSFFSAIFGRSGVEFTVVNLSLQVGETYDLDDILECDFDSVSLSSSDDEIVRVSGTTAEAMSVGVAYITASASIESAKLRVTVAEKQPDTLEIEHDGKLDQTADGISTVTFYARATGSIPNKPIEWYVNGIGAGTYRYGLPFEFEPSGVGEYKIKAVAGGLVAERVVRCYYKTEASVECADTGMLDQRNAPFSDVVFNVTAEQNALNPEDHIEWFEDGTLIYDGGDKNFTYSPSAGRHTIAAYVNGVCAYTADGFFKGSVTPDAPTVDFDNLYPHVYVGFETKGKAAVEITSPDGNTEVYSQTDPEYANLFTDRGFDAATVMSPFSDSGNMRRAYTLRVKSLGDGDAYTESGYSDKYVFTQQPDRARKYWQTQCLNGDLYVTSEYEFVEVAAYYVFFRNKKTEKPKVSFDCYIAYEMEGDAYDLWQNTFILWATAGNYSGINLSVKNSVLHVSFTVNCANNPTGQSESDNRYRQLHAVIPHINYDETLYRPNDHVFPVDQLERTVEVEYSDELFLAVQSGVKPLPKSGSSAEVLYNRARDVLRKICTDGMTDMQKAHAIYDWIMWQIIYDEQATTAAAGSTLGAYFLEGVFGDGSTPIGGFVYSPYAVCDGMSKAYSLLCNIEGIPCVRVRGIAGENGGNHAWNKVFVNGEWYVVDCTWGDANARLTLDGVEQLYELGQHNHLFLTERQIAETHSEPYRTGESSLVFAPTATDKEYSVYKDMTYNGVSINCYIGKSDNVAARLKEISTAFAKSFVKLSTLKIPGGVNGGVYEINYQGFEIRMDCESVFNQSAIIKDAVRSVRPNADVKVLNFGDTLYVLVR